MLVDSHTHVNFKAFREDRDAIMADVVHRGMTIINVGTNLPTSQEAVAIAEHYPTHAYAAIGLHPIYVEKRTFDPAAFDLLAGGTNVVAVGEVGLDAWHFKGRGDLPAVLKAQETLLRQQIDLAQRHDLALMLHCRDAYNSLLDILCSYGRKFRGQIHCFMGTEEQAQGFMELGLNVGFTGVITFLENTELRDVVRRVPMDRIHVETDAPYLTPEPHRRERNLPWYVEYTARAVGELKGIPLEDVIRATADNTGRTYRFRDLPADS